MWSKLQNAVHDGWHATMVTESPGSVKSRPPRLTLAMSGVPHLSDMRRYRPNFGNGPDADLASGVIGFRSSTNQMTLQFEIGRRGCAERLGERGGNFDLATIRAVAIDERTLRNPQHDIPPEPTLTGPSIQSRDGVWHCNLLQRFDRVDEPNGEPRPIWYGTGKNFVQETVCV